MWGVTFYSHILIRIWNCSDSVVYFVFHVSYTNRRFSGCLCLIHLYNGFYMDKSLTQTRTFWPSSVFLLSCHFGHLQCSCYPVILAIFSVPAILFMYLGCIVLKTLIYLTMFSVPVDGYSRNVSCALNLISTFLFTYLYRIHTYFWHLFWHVRYKQHSFDNESKLQLYPWNYKQVGLTNIYVDPFIRFASFCGCTLLIE